MTEPERLVRNWKNAKHRSKARKRGFEVQEKLGAELHDAQQTRGSGCSRRPSRKGDSVSTYFRQSDKTTSKRSFSIKRDEVEEILLQAEATGHRAMFMFGFDAGQYGDRVDMVAFDPETAAGMVRAVAALLEGNIVEAKCHAKLAVGSY